MEQTAQQQTARRPGGPAWLPWVTVVARVIIGGALAWAGLAKIGDLSQSVVAVRAYELPIPDGLVTAIGYCMPIFEIVIGLALIVGLFTRWVGLIGALTMIVYIAGISSAWARGLNIDCGCFTPGGVLNPGQDTKYLQDILRDVGFLICGAWTVWRPSAPLSVDRWIAGPTVDDEPETAPAS